MLNDQNALVMKTVSHRICFIIASIGLLTLLGLLLGGDRLHRTLHEAYRLRFLECKFNIDIPLRMKRLSVETSVEWVRPLLGGHSDGQMPPRDHG